MLSMIDILQPNYPLMPNNIPDPQLKIFLDNHFMIPPPTIKNLELKKTQNAMSTPLHPTESKLNENHNPSLD